MIKKIAGPTIVEAAGNKRKIIEEYFGLVNSGDARVSIARMRSPSGWIEPGQRPGTHDILAGEAILVSGGEWVRYSTPGPAGAEYVAVCLPAFSLDTVHRDE
jgi:hypothetical protein